MPAPSFGPKLWLITVFFLVWGGCLVGAAYLGSGETWHDRLLYDSIQALGAAALVLGGIGAWIEWYRRRRWRRLTQSIALDLLEQCMRHTGAITSQAAYVLLGDERLRRHIDDLFKFPWSIDRALEVEAATGALKKGFVIEHPDVTAGKRANEVRAELATRADKLRSAALELSEYVDEGYVLKLVKAVIWLHKGVRELTDEVPRFTEKADSQALLYSVNVLLMAKDSVAVAQCLGEPYLALRKGLKDTRLRNALVSAEELAEMDVKHKRDLRETMEGAEKAKRESTELLHSMNDDLERLSEALDELLAEAAQETAPAGST